MTECKYTKEELGERNEDLVALKVKEQEQIKNSGEDLIKYERTGDTFTDLREAYNWLLNHPLTSELRQSKIGASSSYKYIEHHTRCLDIEVYKINPEIDEIDDDDTKNTKTQISLEYGPWFPKGFSEDFPELECAGHDMDLDTWADTFEEAILELANKVATKYPEFVSYVEY